MLVRRGPNKTAIPLRCHPEVLRRICLSSGREESDPSEYLRMTTGPIMGRTPVLLHPTNQTTPAYCGSFNPASFTVLSPNRSTGAPAASSIDRYRLHSGVFGA